MLLSLSANAVVVQLGDQNFADGVGVNGVAAFNPTAVGEPVPFDQFRGSDLSVGTPLSESWTFNFAAQPYLGGTFTLGITDHDSRAPGSQVAFFGFDGNDLTSLLDTAFESSGGRPGNTPLTQQGRRQTTQRRNCEVRLTGSERGRQPDGEKHRLPYSTRAVAGPFRTLSGLHVAWTILSLWSIICPEGAKADSGDESHAWELN